MVPADIEQLMYRFHCPDDDVFKLGTALRNLKLWTGQFQITLNYVATPLNSKGIQGTNVPLHTGPDACVVWLCKNNANYYL